MSLIFSSFSQNIQQPLPSLIEEYTNLMSFLNENNDKVDFTPVYNLEVEELTSRLLIVQNDLRLFHFSGHSTNDQLDFVGEDFDGEDVAAFFNLLGNEDNNLQCVFLNGCSNEEIVNQLSNVPVVIGTKEPIVDDIAMQFTGNFFRALIGGEQNYRNAFNQALEASSIGDEDFVITRGGGAAIELEEVGDYFMVENDATIATGNFDFKVAAVAPVVDNDMSWYEKLKEIWGWVVGVPTGIVGLIGAWYFFCPNYCPEIEGAFNIALINQDLMGELEQKFLKPAERSLDLNEHTFNREIKSENASALFDDWINKEGNDNLEGYCQYCPSVDLAVTFIENDNKVFLRTNDGIQERSELWDLLGLFNLKRDKKDWYDIVDVNSDSIRTKFSRFDKNCACILAYSIGKVWDEKGNSAFLKAYMDSKPEKRCADRFLKAVVLAQVAPALSKSAAKNNSEAMQASLENARSQFEAMIPDSAFSMATAEITSMSLAQGFVNTGDTLASFEMINKALSFNDNPKVRDFKLKICGEFCENNNDFQRLNIREQLNFIADYKEELDLGLLRNTVIAEAQACLERLVNGFPILDMYTRINETKTLSEGESTWFISDVKPDGLAISVPFMEKGNTNLLNDQVDGADLETIQGYLDDADLFTGKIVGWASKEWASTSDSERLNQRLSKKRARNVAKYMDLDYEGMGISQQFTDLEKNRRAEVIISQKGN